jgi:hypothetical protein
VLIQEGKNDPQQQKKFEVLGVLFLGLKSSPVAWMFFKLMQDENIIFFKLVNQ